MRARTRTPDFADISAMILPLVAATTARLWVSFLSGAAALFSRTRPQKRSIERIKQQHPSAKLTVGGKIGALLDASSCRYTPELAGGARSPEHGVLTRTESITGRTVLMYSQDLTETGKFLTTTHA